MGKGGVSRLCGEEEMDEERTVSATETVSLRSFRRDATSATRGRMEGGGKEEEEAADIVARVLLREWAL